jgi:hypothetical protein
MICQVCGAPNELDRELCRKCQSKLLVVSGSRESYDEGSLSGGSGQDDGISLDEHLLERVSVLEEIVKRCAETLKPFSTVEPSGEERSSWRASR